MSNQVLKIKTSRKRKYDHSLAMKLDFMVNDDSGKEYTLKCTRHSIIICEKKKKKKKNKQPVGKKKQVIPQPVGGLEEKVNNFYKK